jgi:hypothetical protein
VTCVSEGCYHACDDGCINCHSNPAKINYKHFCSKIHWDLTKCVKANKSHCKKNLKTNGNNQGIVNRVCGSKLVECHGHPVNGQEVFWQILKI